jgi:hypothetical protein
MILSKAAWLVVTGMTFMMFATLFVASIHFERAEKVRRDAARPPTPAEHAAVWEQWQATTRRIAALN